MFDSKSSQMRIRNKASYGARITDLFLEQGPVVLRRSHDPNAGLFEPTLDASHGLAGCQRSLVNPRICCDTDEGVQHGPAEVHRI